MTSYSHLSPTETAIMTLLSILSNLAGLPIVARSLPNKCTRFEGIVVAMSILTSMLYHICEIYDCTLFLNQLQWHRLDNVFAITSFELVILYACGSIRPQDEGLKWFSFLFAIVIQEKDPWNVAYTVFPCVLFFMIGTVMRWQHRKSRKVHYDKKNMSWAIVPFLIGLFFFYLGLDDPNDYLRMFHWGWHVCASTFAYYCFISVTITTRQHKIHQDDEQTSLKH